ncbi:hypothetical protein [Solibacillus sp. R5-41]|uniref:hypothetical protein n=1 Tax=Solibacillus sp. R5-41 TaxID=2048654 RepID=UPI0012FD6B8C|nr:hypothetical protein [Solibacillus sp. R5-41]
MDYEVAFAYGSEGLITDSVNGVDEITVEDGAYFFFDSDEEMIYSAPLVSVVYIKRV